MIRTLERVGLLLSDMTGENNKDEVLPENERIQMEARKIRQKYDTFIGKFDELLIWSTDCLNEKIGREIFIAYYDRESLQADAQKIEMYSLIIEANRVVYICFLYIKNDVKGKEWWIRINSKDDVIECEICACWAELHQFANETVKCMDPIYYSIIGGLIYVPCFLNKWEKVRKTQQNRLNVKFSELTESNPKPRTDFPKNYRLQYGPDGGNLVVMNLTLSFVTDEYFTLTYRLERFEQGFFNPIRFKLGKGFENEIETTIEQFFGSFANSWRENSIKYGELDSGA